MSDVAVWSVFAYMTGDTEGRMDEHRRPAQWQLHHVVDWCVDRGYDNIYISRDPVATARFDRGAPVPVSHKMHLVEGSGDEQPGDAA